MNVIEKNKKILEETRAKQAEELAKINDYLPTIESEISSQLEALDAAEANLDAESYSKIEEKISVLNKKREMYKNRLSSIKNKNYIPKEQTQSIEDEIRDFMKKEDDRLFKNASNLLEKLEDLYTECNNLRNEAEKTIRDLQTNFTTKGTTGFNIYSYEIRGENLRDAMNCFKEFEAYKLILNYNKK
nr:MAG TPA: hypothetical protein [Caudoviricetes sp.]